MLAAWSSSKRAKRTNSRSTARRNVGGSAAREQANASTWEFDGTTWSKGPDGPDARQAYDAKRNRVIIFGGLGPSGMLGDTWSWDGRVWTKLADTSPTGPDPRAMGYLAYDKRRDRVVLFGGRKGWPTDLNDTWEFDGTAWRRVGG